MFKVFFAASATILLFANPARADISADLKFCAGLKSGKERLACYDAAARIEKREAKVVTTRMTTLTPASNAMAYSPPSAPPKSRFDGTYIGATDEYEFPITEGTSNTYRNYYSGGPSVPDDSLRGLRAGAVIGYNVTSDRFLAGVEARGQYLNSKNSASTLFGIGSGIFALPPQFDRSQPLLQRHEVERRWQAAQNEAERAGKGMWAGSFVKPWDYRPCIKGNGAITWCSDEAQGR